MLQIYDNCKKLMGTVLRREKHPAGSSDWDVEYLYQPFKDMAPASRSSSHNTSHIEFEEIRKATKNFGSDMLLGKGRLGGGVYKGWIDETAVAAKKLHLQQDISKKQVEIDNLCRLRHPNLVNLIGYSFDRDNHMILVYEFMPKGSLSNYLFTGGYVWFPWAERMKVAIGVARALAFLHALETPVVHRNVNSSVIFLDGAFNAKLSEIGIGMDGRVGEGHGKVVCLPMCDYGHIAPEYIFTGLWTTRCDVFAFGGVVLELMSGLRFLDMNRLKRKQTLLDWPRCNDLKDEKRVGKMMDRRLEGEYPRKEAYQVAKIALQCLSEDRHLRPRMCEVVAALEKLS